MDDNLEMDEDDLVDDLQRAFQKLGHRRRRVRSQSYCDNNPETDIVSSESEVVYTRRPRSNSEPSTGAIWKKQQRRAHVRFPTPFSHKELEELSSIIAGEPDKMETIDLDFIGVSVNACKTKKLGDLAEVDDDEEDFEDLRLSHFQRALQEGRLQLKSDKIWRYKRHRKVMSRSPVDEWLRNSCNNNHDLMSNAF